MSDQRDDLLTRYFSAYLGAEEVQLSDEATTDPQLASIAALLADWCVPAAQGTLIDIGCGKGVLFQRLLEIGLMQPSSRWTYVGVDSEENLAALHEQIRKNRNNRFTELIEINEFYNEWPHISDRQVIFCRNVLHEIGINDTSRLLEHVANNSSENDRILIQDFVKFPKGERHNVCWWPKLLPTVLTTIGFRNSRSVTQYSRSGNAWFNVMAEGPSTVSKTTVSHGAVLGARMEQWQGWDAVAGQDGDKITRDALIDTLDFDLQFAALTRQLRNEGALELGLPPDLERKIAEKELLARFDSAADAEPREHSVVERVRLRERGEQLAPLEAFLRGPDRLAIVMGGPGVGKTALVTSLLANRAYEKRPVVLSGTRLGALWPAVESLLSEFDVHLAPEILSVISGLSWQTIGSAATRFFQRIASRTIVFIDDFDEALDSNAQFEDSELGYLFRSLIESVGAKVIVASRSGSVPAALQRAAGVNAPTTVRVGRYATERTVSNILDDHFDRGSAGVSEYPSRLLSAIDRHPLMASLAAENLRKHGARLLHEERFLGELEGRMRHALWERLVDDRSRPAVEAAGNLRIPVPRSMLDRLSTRLAVDRGISDAVLYEVNDWRWGSLVSPLALFRTNQISSSIDEAVISSKVDHGRISDYYQSIYQQDDDPKWIRESYFHRMLSAKLSGSEVVGRYGIYYYSELLASADYAFKRRRDHKLALELYDAASRIKELPEDGKMHRASCLIRLGKRVDGEREFDDLIRKYENNSNIRSSFVDALLFIRDYEAARLTMEEYGVSEDDGVWAAGQWGRCYLGLGKYAEAERVIRKQLAQPNPAPEVYVTLARALQHQGAVQDAVDVLIKGARRYPDSVSIQVAMGANLERLRQDDAAIELLEPIFGRNPQLTHAALALVKIYVRSGDLPAASETLSAAKRYVSDRDRILISAIECELLIGKGLYSDAVQALKLYGKNGDETALGILIEAYYHWALNEPEGEKRKAICREAFGLKLAPALRRNAAVQINMGRMAIILRDKIRFEGTLKTLRSTKVPRRELEVLQEQWESGL